jgi:hypothetical protein
VALARTLVAVARRARHAVGAALALCAGLACDPGTTVVVPVIDIPTEDADATASALDGIALTVAHAGNERDLVAQNFARGVPIELPDVPFGDDLVLHMSGFVGASNVAYGRSCTFALAPGDEPPETHLFFSRSVKFASLGLTPLPRIGGLGISYLGAALLIGGAGVAADDAVTQVERFDPATGRLSRIGTVRARDRAVQALVGTAPPRVVVIGGADGADGAKFIEVVDERRIDRIDVPEMARIDLTATSLTDGRVIVVGGNPPGQPPVKDLDEISERDGTLEVRRLPTALTVARSGHSATRLGDDVGAPVLIAGGVDAAGAPVAAAELFKPLSEEVVATFSPQMMIARHHHVATLMPDGSVLIIGGLDAMGLPVVALELFSVDGGFTTAGNLPGGAGVIDFATTTLPDGRILLTGGRSAPGGAPLDTAYIARLNPLDGSVDVVPTDHMAIRRAGHHALLLCDGTVLVTGGNPQELLVERYNPPPAARR